MNKKDMIKKIDKYAVSLADKGHVWTPEERKLYSIATSGTKPENVKFYPQEKK
jgi:hypothetical protein